MQKKAYYELKISKGKASRKNGLVRKLKTAQFREILMDIRFEYNKYYSLFLFHQYISLQYLNKSMLRCHKI